ncbi:MAG: hypothetical protein ACPGUV_14055, partial [Polyangiales bacterium]
HGRMVLSHTGNLGAQQPTGSKCDAHPDNAFADKVQAAFAALPAKSDFFVRFGRAPGGDEDVLFHHQWWTSRDPGFLAAYFEALDIRTLIIGHTSHAFDGSITHQQSIAATRVLGRDGAQVGTFIKTDARLNGWRHSRLGPPQHWMLRCSAWSSEGDCDHFERLVLQQKSAALAKGWQDRDAPIEAQWEPFDVAAAPILH